MSAHFSNPSAGGKRTRVLLVDDSALTLAVLKRMLAPFADIEVVGTAGNGKDAIEMIPRVQPQVICTDLHMPVMDGLHLTKEIIAKYALPILVVTVSVEEGSKNVFQLLEAGALDVLSKPLAGGDGASRAFAHELVMKIRILRVVKVLHKGSSANPETSPAPSLTAHDSAVPRKPLRIVVIGASTGGPQSLRSILSGLPSDFPVPLVCVQHISEGFLQGLVAWLGSQCRLEVKIAWPGTAPRAGAVYFAPEGSNLEFDAGGRFVLSADPRDAGHWPSVTVTMRSAAQAFGSAAAAVLLSGMGNDGADGMRAVAQAAGVTIAQDKRSCVVFGMPKAAIEMGAAQYVLSPAGISDLLTKMARSRVEVAR